MILSYWTLAVALSLSVIAAWYSIAGLTAIFAAAAVPIIIMGGIMEVAKVTVTVWLHEYWPYCKRSMKAQLSASVVLLMFITSMGIFGFLSKAHTDQALVSGDVGAKIAIYDEKIKIAKDNIDANRKALTQMDAAVDQTMARSSDEKGADKAVAVRRSQQAERGRLLKEIEVEQKKIQALNEEAAPIRAEVRKVEAEVGPIKYIAALIYGDNPDANVLEKAVRWVIIILVIVFDPLAIMMVLAATESLKWEKENKFETPVEIDNKGVVSWFNKVKDQARFWKKKETVEELTEKITPENLHEEQLIDQHTHIPVETYYAPSVPPMSVVEQKELAEDPMIRTRNGLEDLTERLSVPTVELDMYNDERLVSKFDKESGFVSPNAPGLDASDERPGDYLTDHEKTLERAWKAENPKDTLKHQRQLFETGSIAQLPWLTDEFQKKLFGTVADNIKGTASEVKGFGIAFPSDAKKGDMFLRVDRMPSALYKYNGSRWIEVDKTLSDQYAYDEAYIDHLIEKIDSGEYDVDLLSDAEREQISQRLK